MSYELGNLSNVEDRNNLGFSLKPPKWLRKAQPGKILKKYALPIAAIGAAFLIPGAAPLLAKGAVGAGKFLGRGAIGAGRVFGKGGASLFKFGKKLLSPDQLIGPPAPPGTPDFGSQPPPAATAPGFSPVPSIPTGPEVQSEAATMQTGGGGGGGMSPTAPFMDEAAPETAGAGVPKPGMSPLLIIGGLLLVGSMFKKSSRRR
jgi:hypothetical protein